MGKKLRSADSRLKSRVPELWKWQLRPPTRAFPHLQSAIHCPPFWKAPHRASLPSTSTRPNLSKAQQERSCLEDRTTKRSREIEKQAIPNRGRDEASQLEGGKTRNDVGVSRTPMSHLIPLPLTNCLTCHIPPNVIHYNFDSLFRPSSLQVHLGRAVNPFYLSVSLRCHRRTHARLPTVCCLCTLHLPYHRTVG